MEFSTGLLSLNSVDCGGFRHCYINQSCTEEDNASADRIGIGKDSSFYTMNSQFPGAERS